jgi:hypothetical protein
MIWKQWKRGKVRFAKLRQRNIRPALAAQTAGSPHGPWRLAHSRPCSPPFRLLTSIRSVFHGCWMCSSSTELNRRMRTRMYGGVAGESGRPLPLCRLYAVHVRPHTASPNGERPASGFIAGTNLSNRRMRDPLVRWCARGGEGTLPLCRLPTEEL